MSTAGRLRARYARSVRVGARRYPLPARMPAPALDLMLMLVCAADPALDGLLMLAGVDPTALDVPTSDDVGYTIVRLTLGETASAAVKVRGSEELGRVLQTLALAYGIRVDNLFDPHLGERRLPGGAAS